MESQDFGFMHSKISPLLIQQHEQLVHLPISKRTTSISSPCPEPFAGNQGTKRISDLWCLVQVHVVTTTGKIQERIMAVQKIQNYLIVRDTYIENTGQTQH